MPFVRVNEKKRIAETKKIDPKFKKIWEDGAEEYRLLGEMTAIRNKSNITQKELASLIGCKQQALSRIERKETKPSLRMFTRILGALGYRVTIEKMNSK